MSFIKNFIDWFGIKPKLNEVQNRPLFNEREVWNCHLGANIGFELDGKNKNQEGYLRPVIVIKKLSHNTFIGIPLTSQLYDKNGRIRNGSWYYPSFIAQKEGRFCLNQIRMIDAKRLHSLIEQIGKKEFENLKKSFIKLLI